MSLFFNPYQTHQQGFFFFFLPLQHLSNLSTPVPFPLQFHSTKLPPISQTSHLLPCLRAFVHVVALPGTLKHILSSIWPKFHSRLTISKVFLDSKLFPDNPVRKGGDISTPHSRYAPDPWPKQMLRLLLVLIRTQSLIYDQV